MKSRIWHLDIQSGGVDGEVELRLNGRLGHATAARLEAAGLQAASGRQTRVVIDLAGVDYLSSAGLRAIETLDRALRARGADLGLRAPNVAVRLALDLAGLSGLIRE